MESLAIKYRPKTFDDVVGQDCVKAILSQQLKRKEIQHAYLFCGGAGTGKTTCARIFASEINDGSGNPIEMDAASQNGVDDVREIIQQAKTKPLDSEYKVFIIDECHAFSNNAWQAMLKIIEEPPVKSIFIFCTTDPQKIPKTIISRVQRYDFQRISQDGIVDRLKLILDLENVESFDYTYDWDSLEYIAKIADGGMRDAITLLDKCLAYTPELTTENVVKALGTVDYDIMFSLTSALGRVDNLKMIEVIETIHSNGKDLKQFIKLYIQFILDISKYYLNCEWRYIQIPRLAEYEKKLEWFKDFDTDWFMSLLSMLIRLNADIKYSSTAKFDIESALLVFMYESEEHE